jgi:hypothetical protein
MSTDSQPKEYYIKRLDSNNLADVEKLHAAVYGKNPVPGFFAKKYDTSFTNVMYIGFVAYNNQHLPIGYYGVTPCFIKFADKIVLAAQSADTMTHPLHRFKGLFVELSTMTFQLCQQAGIKLLFGFPNQNSLPGAINKLGWQMTERMDCFIIPAGRFNLIRLLKKISFFNNWFTNYKQNQLNKYLLPQHSLNNSVLKDGFAGVYRDNYYLKYKAYTDTHVIKIAGATVWIKLNHELLIGDIIVESNDFDAMINQLKKLTRKLGIKEIHFHTSPGTTLHRLFSSRFKATPSFPVLFQNFEGDAPIAEIKFTSADIDTF